MTISTPHKDRLHEICTKLTVIGSKESGFTAVELLFYEAIGISRTYGNNPAENEFLYGLKQLEAAQYKDTKQFFKKSSQREQVIKKFISRLKKVIYLHTQPVAY